MNAEEARVMSIANANLIRQKEADESLQKATADAAEKVKQSQQYCDDLIRRIRHMINIEVSSGRRAYSYQLHSHTLGSPYSDPLYGDGYLSISPFRLEVKHVMDELERDGYTVSIQGTSSNYDGDLLGTYWQYDTLLQVEW